LSAVDNEVEVLQEPVRAQKLSFHAIDDLGAPLLLLKKSGLDLLELSLGRRRKHRDARHP
jgi:hypothetical protein